MRSISQASLFQPVFRRILDDFRYATINGSADLRIVQPGNPCLDGVLRELLPWSDWNHIISWCMVGSGTPHRGAP